MAITSAKVMLSLHNIESGKKIHHIIVAITSAMTMEIRSATVSWQ